MINRSDYLKTSLLVESELTDPLGTGQEGAIRKRTMPDSFCPLNVQFQKSDFLVRLIKGGSDVFGSPLFFATHSYTSLHVTTRFYTTLRIPTQLKRFLRASMGLLCPRTELCLVRF